MGLMARGPEDHLTDSRELSVPVEGDEWAHEEARDLDAGYWARRKRAALMRSDGLLGFVRGTSGARVERRAADLGLRREAARSARAPARRPRQT